MSGKNKNKTKKRNIKGRKNPAFAEAVVLMFRDSHVTIEELMEKKPNKEFDEASGRMIARYDELPDGCTPIVSLNGNAIFKDERLFRHIDRIALALGEFGSEFYNEAGAPVQALRLDKKGRVWGEEYAILCLAYLAIAAGLAEWTQDRSEWKNNEDRMPRIKFTFRTDDKTAGEIYDSIKNDPDKITTDPSTHSLPIQGTDQTSPATFN